MKFLELSLEQLREISIEAAEEISKKVNIDLVIYIAKAGFPIAYYMNEVFKVPMLGIAAQRKGNKLKSFISPLVKHCPKIVRNTLITMELKSRVHKWDINRNVWFHKSIEALDTKDFTSILIVDDSVDTGCSLMNVRREVRKQFHTAKIYSYSMNVWDESRSSIETDFYSYCNTIIRAPMSKDSREFPDFCKMYNTLTDHGFL